MKCQKHPPHKRSAHRGRNKRKFVEFPAIGLMYRLRLAGAVVPIHGSKNAARTAAVHPAPLAAGPTVLNSPARCRRYPLAARESSARRGVTPPRRQQNCPTSPPPLPPPH